MISEHKMFVCGLSVCCALVMASPVAAQRLSDRDLERFDAYLLTDPVVEVREAHLVAMRDMRFPDCTEAPQYERVVPSRAGRDDYLWAVYFMNPFRRNDVAPSIALWAETYEVTYCGNAVRENAGFAILSAGRAPFAEWDAPGYTRASITHIDDILEAIRQSGTSAISPSNDDNCGEEFDRRSVVQNTQRLGEEGASRTSLNEKWSISYCGIDEEFDVTFTMGRDRDITFTAYEIGVPRAAGRQPDLASAPVPEPASEPIPEPESTERAPSRVEERDDNFFD